MLSIAIMARKASQDERSNLLLPSFFVFSFGSLDHWKRLLLRTLDVRTLKLVTLGGAGLLWATLSQVIWIADVRTLMPKSLAD